MSGFHGAFATGVASQQGTLTLPDTWFRPPFWDLLMLQLLRPNSSNLPCLYSTFHLEYPLVLSRFCFLISTQMLQLLGINTDIITSWYQLRCYNFLISTQMLQLLGIYTDIITSWYQLRCYNFLISTQMLQLLGINTDIITSWYQLRCYNFLISTQMLQLLGINTDIITSWYQLKWHSL